MPANSCLEAHKAFLGGYCCVGIAVWASLGRHLWVAPSTLWGGGEGMCLVEGMLAAVARPLPVVFPV